ncbi:hypothetical protein V8E52_000901 [Russula decolorans]|jgi:hypothetical protein
MQSLDIVSFCLSVIGAYGIVYSLRLLLPRNVIPHVSTTLDEAMILLDRAEDINALANTGEYRATLTIIRNQVVLFRTESHRARGVFQQLRLVFLSGLTYRLYAISAQIEETRMRIELAVDEQRLASIIVV